MPESRSNLQLVSRTPSLVSLTDAKLHLRVVGTQDDGYISTLLEVASDHVAQRTNRQPEDAVYTLTVSSDSARKLCETLPRFPLRSIISAAADGVPLTATDVELKLPKSAFPIIESVGVEAKTWEITFRAGHGGDASIGDLIEVAPPPTPPPQMLHAIRILVGHWFEIREEVLIGSTQSTMPRTVEPLLSLLARSHN